MQRLVDEHRAARRDNHKLLFSLVVLEEGLRGHAAPAPREPAHAAEAATAAVA